MASTNVTPEQLAEVKVLLKTKKPSAILRDAPELSDALDKAFAQRGRGSGAMVPREQVKAVDF